MSNKKIKEYFDKYGEIPNEYNDRFSYLLKSIGFKDKDVATLREKLKKIMKIKYNELSFVFYFTPQASPRPRYSKFTKAFYVKNKLDYPNIFKDFIENSDINYKIITPCEFHCKTYIQTPNNMNKVEKALAELGMIKHISKPDWDNLAKTYCDMIQKSLLTDDAIIYKGSLEKLYSIKPRIEITIKYMTEFDSKYNETKAKAKIVKEICK